MIACGGHALTGLLGIVVPSEVLRAIPTGSAIAANAAPDFDGYGQPDFLLTYGPESVDHKNTEIGVLVDVNGGVTKFERSGQLQFSVGDVTGDRIDDLTITWIGPPEVIQSYTWSHGDWGDVSPTPRPQPTFNHRRRLTG